MTSADDCAVATVDVIECAAMHPATFQVHDSLRDAIAAEPSLQVQPEEVFASAAWFETLASAGFEQEVLPLWILAREPAAGSVVALGMRREAGGLVALANYYSALWAPLGAADQASSATWCAVAGALRVAGGRVLRLQPVSAQAQWLEGLRTALRGAGYWVDQFFCFGNWYLPVQGRSAAELFAARPSALRYSVERGRRRLGRAGAWELRIHTGEPADLETVVDDFTAVYARSWKQPEPCPAFMPSLIRAAAAQGWLRLAVLRLQGEPIAAQVWLVCAGKASIYKLAYVEGFERFSPGSVLTTALMAHVIDVDRVGEVDYLSGDDAYKRDWMELRRERVGLVAFDARHWRGWLGALRHFAPRWLGRRADRTPAPPSTATPAPPPAH
jgi:CelD/BcsL family acetyltransferase involved in cellulose biosynthesis